MNLSLAAVFLMAVQGLLIFGDQDMAEKKSQLTVLDEIQGSNFLIIRSVVPVFRRRNLDIQLYKIALLRDDQSVIVLFSRVDEKNEVIPRNLGIRGTADVEMNSVDLSSSLSKVDLSKPLDIIRGKSFLAIQTADAVFQQRLKADLVRYKITLAREGDSVSVIFTDKDGKPGGRGGPGVVPAFEVQLTADSLQVMRSNFVR
jgi:hypothetical protein